MLRQAAKVNMRNEMLAGAVNFLTAVTSILVVFNMLEQAGMPYGGAFPALILSSALATLVAGSKFDLPIVVLPAMGMSGFLSYDLIINQGYSWQTIAMLTFLAGMALLLLNAIGGIGRLQAALPEYFPFAVPGAMGLCLLYRGLAQGRLVIGDPFVLTGPGSISEPVAYAALLALLVTVALELWQVPGSLFCGMMSALLVLLLQGFIALPAQLCLVPDAVFQTVGCLELATDRLENLLLPFLVLILGLISDSIMADSLIPNKAGRSSGIYLNGLGAICCGVLGGGSLSAAEGAALAKGAGGKTGLAAKVSFVILCIALFFGPMMRELAEQPGITSAALIVTGTKLLWHSLRLAGQKVKCCRQGEAVDGNLPAALTTIVLVSLWNSLTAGLGAGLCVYVLWELLAGRGRQLAWFLYVISFLFVMYFSVFL